MKLSLLELTQNILSALDSDEVNSIADTAEARQVAQVIKTAYFNILARANLPEHHELFSLDASGDSSLPVLMSKPTDVLRIDWLKYNVSEDSTDRMVEITVKPLKEFLDTTHFLVESATNVDTFTLDGHTFYFKNDAPPCQCTILRDFHIIFDSYDSGVEATLQSSKTLGYGLIAPSFELSDSFIPEIDDYQFPLLLNEAKSLAFLELKQITHEKAEQEARRQWRSLQRNKFVHLQSDFDRLPYFGRK